MDLDEVDGIWRSLRFPPNLLIPAGRQLFHIIAGLRGFNEIYLRPGIDVMPMKYFLASLSREFRWIVCYNLTDPGIASHGSTASAGVGRFFMRRIGTAFAFAFAVLAALASVPLGAQERGLVITGRVGMPTDTLVNIADLYHWGIAAEGGATFAVNDWFAVGGLAGYGFSLGKPPLVPEYKHQVHAALRLAFGNLDRLSASLIGGIVVFLEDELFVFPDLGVSLDYGPVSLGLSTGSASAGMNFRL